MRSKSVSVRKSVIEDIDNILLVYEGAKRYMRQEGNHSQWIDGYPGHDVIEADIKAGNHYLIEDSDGNILMTFSFIIGPDPTYSYIEGGEWIDETEYGTIHRAASSGMKRGMMKKCIEFCFSRIDNIRVDTHADNLSMKRALTTLDFKKCGIIYLKDGRPRVAFQKLNRII